MEIIFSSQTKKRPRYDDKNFDIVQKCFGKINEPLNHLFILSLANRIFPKKIRITKDSISIMATLKILQSTAQYLYLSLFFLRSSSV